MPNRFFWIGQCFNISIQFRQSKFNFSLFGIAYKRTLLCSQKVQQPQRLLFKADRWLSFLKLHRFIGNLFSFPWCKQGAQTVHPWFFRIFTLARMSLFFVLLCHLATSCMKTSHRSTFSMIKLNSCTTFSWITCCNKLRYPLFTLPKLSKERIHASTCNPTQITVKKRIFLT